MAEDRDLEKCNFQNFKSPITFTLDRVIRHMAYPHRPLSRTYQISLKSEKLFVDRWTYGCTNGHTYGCMYGHTYWRTFQTPSNVIRLTWRSWPNKHTKNKPKPKPKPQLIYKNCSCVCVYQCAQMLYTTQHRTVMIISPFIRQTIIIAKAMSTAGMRTCKNKLKQGRSLQSINDDRYARLTVSRVIWVKTESPLQPGRSTTCAVAFCTQRHKYSDYYTVYQKNKTPNSWLTLLSNLNQFSKFCHWYTQ